MASVKITVNGALMDGHKITFKAPCDCVNVENLKVCYVKNGTQQTRVFTMKDSHGNDLTGLGNLFSEGAYVDVVLDTNNGFAYLQNASTNAYLEAKTTPVDNLLSDSADLPLSARQGKILNNSLNVQKITAKTSLTNLLPQITVAGTRKMFYAPNNTYLSDFPTALSEIATLSPFITLTRLDGVHALIEITAFGANTGIPKSIKGCCNWTTGTFYWNDVV